MFQKIKKLYGDIFEAIKGAVILDMNFRIDLYENVLNDKIKNWLWCCYKVRSSIDRI